MYSLLKRSFTLACLAFGLLSLFAVCGRAQISDDDKEVFVQNHFHFKDPETGKELPTDSPRLYGILSKKFGANGSSTYFNQGYTVAKLMDLREKYGQNQFYITPVNIYDLVNDSIGLSFGSPDIPTALEFLIQTTFEDNAPVALILLAWDSYSAIKTSWNIINEDVQGFYSAQINSVVKEYIQDMSAGGDPDHDDEQWSDVNQLINVPKLEQRIGNGFSLHEFCRAVYKQKQQIDSNLDQSINAFTDNINNLLAGGTTQQPSVRFTFSPAAFSLYAPVSVTIDASNSTGKGGSNITAYSWSIDGNAAGAGPSIAQTFWTPGTHTVAVTITDASNYTQTGSQQFTVGSPPIDITSGDGALDRVFTTPANPNVTHYAWDFGDGTPPVSGDTLNTVPHTYKDFGQYTLTLTEKTSHGDTIYTRQPLNFQNSPTDINGGELSYSQDWDLSGSPYRIHSTLKIPVGVRLTLKAGVVLQFDQNAGLNVYGELVSKGQFSSNNRVYITSYRDNSAPSLKGKDEGQSGDWSGLNFYDGAKANLSACTIKYAAYAITGDVKTLSGVRFEKNRTAIVEYQFKSLTVTSSTFRNNGTDLNVSSASSPDVTLTSNTFDNSPNYATVYLSGTLGSLTIHDNQCSGTVPAFFYLGGLTLTKDSTLSPQPTCRYFIAGGSTNLTVAQGATLTLTSGTVVHGSGSLIINGSLAASGAILTSGNDLTPYGGSDSNASPRDWPGVQYADGLTANLQGVTIKYASIGLSVDTANLNGCYILSNSIGVVSAKGGGIYRNCNFVGNNLAVQNNSTNDIDARNNWWGDVSGPYNANSNPGGKGNPVSDHVIIGNLTPTLTTITPNTAIAGGGSVTITLNGSNFFSASKVQWNGTTDLATTFVSNTQLTAIVPSSLTAIATTASITVVNPPLGGGASNSVSFTVTGTARLALTSATANRLSDGRIQVSYVLTNNGTASAVDVTATSARLTGNNGATVSTSAGPATLAPGATLAGTAIFPASVTAGSRTFQIYGKLTGASYSVSRSITIP